ncbi:MAG: heparinase II/III family protein [Pseudomonadota bacterium]
MYFLREKTNKKMLFSQPKNGADVSISPPAFTWLPAMGATGYHLFIYDKNDIVVYQKTLDATPVHIPETVLEPGWYSWDVMASNDEVQISRGKQTFTIEQNVTHLAWVDVQTLIHKVPQHHPRFIYTEILQQEIKVTIQTTRKKSWQRLILQVDHALEYALPVYPSYQTIPDPLQRKVAYKKYYMHFRKTVDQGLQHLAIAYLISRKPEYLYKAKAILLTLAKWPCHRQDVTSVYPQWSGDEVGMSIARCLHRVYDWLYDDLSATERSIVSRACLARAEQIHQKLLESDYLTYPGNSHDGRLILYLAEMGMVLTEVTDETTVWLKYALKAMMTVYPHWGAADGGWAEGLWYAHDYIVFSLPIVYALHNTCGVNLWQRSFYKNFPSFVSYCAALSGEIEPFGDGAEMQGYQSCGEHFAKLMTFLSHMSEEKLIQWWSHQVEKKQSASWETDLIFEDMPDKYETGIGHEYIKHARLFPETGWVALHSNIMQPDTDTFLLLKSSPFGSVSHSHADQNAFVIMKGGKALAIPSGYYGPAYDFPHHKDWTQTTRANNCILVNGEGQPIQNATATGKIVAFQSYDAMDYVAADATAAYQGRLLRWQRHVLFLKPGIIVMLDDLEAPAPSHFEWLLHSFEKMQINDNQIIINRKTASLSTSLFCPAGLTLSQKNQFDPPYNTGLEKSKHRTLPNQWHLTAKTQQSCTKIRIAAVMVVTDKMETIDIEVKNTKGWLNIMSENHFGNIDAGVQLIEGTDSANPLIRNKSQPLMYGKTGTDTVIISDERTLQ